MEALNLIFAPKSHFHCIRYRFCSTIISVQAKITSPLCGFLHQQLYMICHLYNNIKIHLHMTAPGGWSTQPLISFAIKGSNTSFFYCLRNLFLLVIQNEINIHMYYVDFFRVMYICDLIFILTQLFDPQLKIIGFTTDYIQFQIE